MRIFSKKQKYRARQVFIPGGQPTFTYNPRKNLKLEGSLEEAKDFLCKLVMMTGSTKSGKTVLTNKIFPKTETIWFDGGSFSSEQDFWLDIVGQLNVFVDKTKTQSKDSTTQGGIKGGAESQLLLFKLKGEASASLASKNSKASAVSRKGNPKTIALQALRESKRPLIIDDFHYLPREQQGQLVRAVKSLIFDGLPVIFIAIPHRRLDAVKVEREMTGRIETIAVPPWKVEELIEIPAAGFPILNIDLSDSIIRKLASEAIGSPHLMQEFCREICNIHNVKETLEDKIAINSIDEKTLFKSVAEYTGKVIFDKLSKGPRQRADRVQRQLSNGSTTDIYGLVLHALSQIRPGLETIEYETLRNAIRDVSSLAQPQAHEVTRVLDKMSEIAASDESSTPVIDWDKEERVLHITDPFFAFYLRWGIE
ncbi:hypothetical protein FGM00_07220 [Aggregatimonas sangjinii]|uniref:Uncharacterized protein n=1 Tax=Aggregatimonas sangjinii TaxID=2583587 RepID=A0A5B7SSS1_9FLAO|nr:hypothetical protein [Aggregatimonas sangjinii]QCW99899.1 hypothetical protein FGM00_07220 [Aggregatimonas sangjinii]